MVKHLHPPFVLQLSRTGEMDEELLSCKKKKLKKYHELCIWTSLPPSSAATQIPVDRSLLFCQLHPHHSSIILYFFRICQPTHLKSNMAHKLWTLTEARMNLSKLCSWSTVPYNSLKSQNVHWRGVENQKVCIKANEIQMTINCKWNKKDTTSGTINICARGHWNNILEKSLKVCDTQC